MRASLHEAVFICFAAKSDCCLDEAACSLQSSSRFCLADVQECGTRCYFDVQSGFANCIIRSLWCLTCQNGRKHSLCMGWQAKSTWWIVSRTTLWFILINCIPVMINYQTTWAIAGGYKHTQVVGRCKNCITLTTIISLFSFEMLSMPLWPPTQTTVTLFVSQDAITRLLLVQHYEATLLTFFHITPVLM